MKLVSDKCRSPLEAALASLLRRQTQSSDEGSDKFSTIEHQAKAYRRWPVEIAEKLGNVKRQ